MTNWYPAHSNLYEDVQTRNRYPDMEEAKRLPKLWAASRDSARTPMQWTDGENAGFTTGKTRFYVNQNYQEGNVAQQESDPDSVLNFYRAAIALRKKLPVVRDGRYREYRKQSSKRYVYTRATAQQKLLAVCSFSEKPARFRAPKGYPLSKGKLVLTNERTLQPTITLL